LDTFSSNSVFDEKANQGRRECAINSEQSLHLRNVSSCKARKSSKRQHRERSNEAIKLASLAQGESQCQRPFAIPEAIARSAKERER